ncbi:MAG: hypothetical protein LQ348_000248 [Seirophora lacunosa]|nr:MAG: hypothetical protein LQ348_000248 [Seirophora lacunosa]
MPPKDPANNTYHQPGIPRLLDVQFRHLRYDTFEPVIDACYHASQQLAVSFKDPPPLDYEVRQNTSRGTQYSLFRDIKLEDLRFERHGITLRLSFACPSRLRQRRLLSSGHFESGMLMALIGLDSKNMLSTAFCTIDMCQSTLAMKPTTGNHLRASVVASFADPQDIDAARQALHGLKDYGPKQKFVIVELPNVLVAGYYWILKHLQHLSSSNANISFSDFVAPSKAQSNLPVELPAYDGAEAPFFDLSALQDPGKKGMDLAPKVRSDFLELASTDRNALIEDICSATTLDQGQAAALCENLSRGLAFTQGPPGTGKTFLGVSLAKVILEHMPKTPILVACMTNHALDNFLGDLIGQGITRVARLGNGSKEDWTGKYTMASLRKNSRLSIGQSMRLNKSYRGVQSFTNEGTKWCEALNTHTLTWTAVRDHLEKNYSNAFYDFHKCKSYKEQELEDVRQKRQAAGGFAFQHWCTGGDLKEIKGFSRDLGAFFGKTKAGSKSPAESEASEEDSSLESPTEQLGGPVEYPYQVFPGDVWSIPMDVRAAWIAKWKSELSLSNNIDKLAEIQRRYMNAREQRSEVHSEVDASYLADRQVIGMTTLICEEAGEIMEAQTISTLLPSLKHAIFIGDPLQLRPQVGQTCLSLETAYGTKYRLDESLFERMAMPRAPGAQPFPVSKLKLQRRMHPDVADLMRVTLYPFLEDHPSTSRLPVAGMAHRTFWLDHQEPEDAPDALAAGGRSYSNTFECAMISELVRYLLNTNDFNSGDITVLVPYSRQLGCLKERLVRTRTCSIALSNKDKEDLADMGFLDDAELQQFRSTVEVSRMVRLATIDGFQGEEAKVVILSTVRSNIQDRVGFLQTTNRVNVACTRARNGFYIVGNATLLRTVDMWSTIIDNFQSKGRIGSAFITHCSRHPHLAHAVSRPRQFQEQRMRRCVREAAAMRPRLPKQVPLRTMPSMRAALHQIVRSRENL